MSIEQATLKFMLAAFEQGGTESTPEFARLLKLSFDKVDSGILMNATVEAMKTTKGRLTIGDVQKQVDLLSPKTADDHPSAEEAWAAIPKSERETAYLTREMMDAIQRGGINDYLNRGDFIGAERAFKRLYDENVAKSRAVARKAVWQVTLGHDSSMRVLGLERAVLRGVIKSDEAIGYDSKNEAIYLSAERQAIARLPESQQKALSVRTLYLTDAITKLADETPGKTEYEYEPTEAELNDPYFQKQAASLGLTVWEYKVRPCPPEVAARVHAQLSKQYGINLEALTRKSR